MVFFAFPEDARWSDERAAVEFDFVIEITPFSREAMWRDPSQESKWAMQGKC